MKLKQFKAVVLKTNKQPKKPKPFSPFKKILGIQTPLKICPSAHCNSIAMSLIQGKLWLRGIFFAPSGLQFCSDCCVQRSTGYSGKDVGYWHSTGSAFLITGAVQGGVYFICILMSISGDSGSSPPSWDRLTPPLEASFPSPERKPVLV